jgi:hypothetical protein
VAETLRLRAGVSSSYESKTFELRFVDRAGRYILQQQVKIKFHRAIDNRLEWRDVALVKELKEPGK